MFNHTEKGHMKGFIGYNHNDICRDRVKQLMIEDPEYKILMEKHHWGSNNGNRMSHLHLRQDWT